MLGLDKSSCREDEWSESPRAMSQDRYAAASACPSFQRTSGCSFQRARWTRTNSPFGFRKPQAARLPTESMIASKMQLRSRD